MHQVLVARMTYSDSDALVLAADVGRDGPQPVMARVAAADLDAHLARREVELIMKHNHIGGLEPVETSLFGHGLPDSFM